MPELHAKLSPSAANRWMICPGSVVLSQGMPEKASDFAEEGTLAHKMAERWLREGVCPVECSPEMKRYIKVYVDEVNQLFVGGDVRMIEKQVKATDEVWGTADAIVWEESTRTLYVRDLKYGAGIAVEVGDNKQLRIYALGALLTSGFKAKTVNIGVVQPRIPHPDGFIRSKDFDAIDLLEMLADVKDAEENVRFASISAIRDESWQHVYLHPSEKGCKWCLAAPICPALKSQAQDLAKKAFLPAIQPGGVAKYDPQELSEVLDKLPLMEAWIKNVREFAYEEAERGNAIPSYKLVAKRPTRKWKTIEGGIAPHLAEVGLSDDDIFEAPSLKTPAAIEKLLPIDKQRLLDALTVKESSGHVLVHGSDKREAIRVDAKAAFETIEEKMSIFD